MLFRSHFRTVFSTFFAAARRARQREYSVSESEDRRPDRTGGLACMCQSAIRVLLEWRYCESLSRSGRTAQLPARSREVPGQRTFTWNTVGRSRPWTGRSTYIRTACSDDTCLCGLSESWKPSRSQWPQRKAAFQLASVARHSSRPKAEISAQGREVNRPFYAIEWHRISMSVNLLAPGPRDSELEWS